MVSAVESAASILCVSKQTRFHLGAGNPRELDIDGIYVTIIPEGETGETSAPPTKTKASKGKPKEVELLANAQLRLKEGTRYALFGRNGTGKSTLLRAIYEKLIPGVPEETKVAMLQQSMLTKGDNKSAWGEGSVLREVIDKALSRQKIEQEIKDLSTAIEGPDPLAPVRALRTVKHQRVLDQFFLLDKDARLRSGARGRAAREALLAFEKVVEESQANLDSVNGDVPADTFRTEVQEAADMLQDLQIQVEPNRLIQVEDEAKRILKGLGFSEDRMAQPIKTMSGGWFMRASLAVTLLQDADIVILDEPTNYLDLLGIIWLQRHLESLQDRDKSPIIVLVSHDRDFMKVCSDLMILKDKQITYFHGDLPDYESSQAERKLWLKKMKAAKDKQKAHIQKSIAQNIKAGKANDDQNKLRQAKSRQKKLDDRWGMEVNAKGHRFRVNKDRSGYDLTWREQIEIPPDERQVVIQLPEPSDLRFPGPLLSLENASYRYSRTSPPVLQDINLSVSMGDRIGILGLNGAGKSTLIKLLVGTKPSTGTATSHPRLKVGYYSQHAADALRSLGTVEPELTTLALLTREVGDELDEGGLRALCGELGLPGRLASDVPIAKLSGGQLVRCELARLLWKHPHCLVLDEVTTHLDYETVTALRVALHHWAGAVVVVSHDRWFLRGTVEGDFEEDEDSSGEEDEEKEMLRRRTMYRLHAGKMTVLKNGTSDFEALMDKRVKKLLAT